MFKLPGNCSGAFEIEVCGDLLKLLIALRGVASYRGERRDESMVLLLASRGGARRRSEVIVISTWIIGFHQ